MVSRFLKKNKINMLFRNMDNTGRKQLKELEMVA